MSSSLIIPFRAERAFFASPGKAAAQPFIRHSAARMKVVREFDKKLVSCGTRMAACETAARGELARSVTATMLMAWSAAVRAVATTCVEYGAQEAVIRTSRGSIEARPSAMPRLLESSICTSEPIIRRP